MNRPIFAENKIFSFYNEAKKLLEGELVAPRFISIWLTTTCDLSCEYCYFSKTNKEHTILKTERALKLVDELKKMGVEAIEFSGGGEPTIHPQYMKIAKYIWEQGLSVGILTNGLRFDVTGSEYFNYIRIGLDAGNSKLYAKIKRCPESRFNQTIQVVKNLIVGREDTDRPHIGLKFMLNKLNCSFHHIVEMVALATSLKVDYCAFKATHSDKEGLTKEELHSAETTIKYLKSHCDGFIQNGLKRSEAVCGCFMAPIHTVIAANGDVLNCCYFWKKEYVLGNIYEKSFKEIWYDKRHKEVMEKIKLSDCAKVDCRWNKYNQIMKGVLDDGDYDLGYI